ncbi:hypothetical protein SEVIR_9G491550v4 [Setaria viridis]
MGQGKQRFCVVGPDLNEGAGNLTNRWAWTQHRRRAHLLAAEAEGALAGFDKHQSSRSDRSVRGSITSRPRWQNLWCRSTNERPTNRPGRSRNDSSSDRQRRKKGQGSLLCVSLRPRCGWALGASSLRDATAAVATASPLRRDMRRRRKFVSSWPADWKRAILIRDLERPRTQPLHCLSVRG